MATDQIRLATVTATGNRYIVTQLDFDKGVAYCRGELVSYRGLSTRHTAEVELALDAITVKDATKSEPLVKALFTQAKTAANAGQLPGYASDNQTKIARAVRRRDRKAVKIAVNAALTGDMQPLYHLFDKFAAPAVPCGFCSHPTHGTVDGVPACGSCADQLA